MDTTSMDSALVEDILSSQEGAIWWKKSDQTGYNINRVT